MTMAVAPRAAGTRPGTALLDELVARAVADGAAYLMLEVREDNDPARRASMSKGIRDPDRAPTLLPAR